MGTLCHSLTHSLIGLPLVSEIVDDVSDIWLFIKGQAGQKLLVSGQLIVAEAAFKIADVHAVIRGGAYKILLQIVDYNCFAEISAEQPQVFDSVITIELAVLACQNIAITEEASWVDHAQEVISVLSRRCRVQNQLIVLT
mmetsp:Transcript_9990/g.12534  ORF Transcript_9990/g.12534 Transcript_9990/m.12534 type:complete len:140 (+) Transcript_9990:64-483(+)